MVLNRELSGERGTSVKMMMIMMIKRDDYTNETESVTATEIKRETEITATTETETTTLNKTIHTF